MNREQIARLKRRIAKMGNRLANIRAHELESLAIALGRVKSNRGKEPTYVSELLLNSKPLSIPNHPVGVYKFTAGKILDALEQDLFYLEENLDK